MSEIKLFWHSGLIFLLLIISLLCLLFLSLDILLFGAELLKVTDKVLGDALTRAGQSEPIPAFVFDDCAHRQNGPSHFQEAFLCCVTCQSHSSKMAKSGTHLTPSSSALVVLLGQPGLHLLHVTRAGLSSRGQCICAPHCDSDDHEDRL